MREAKLIDSSLLERNTEPLMVCRCLGLWTDRSWSFKIYYHTFDPFEEADRSLVEMAKNKCRRLRHQGDAARYISDLRFYGLGFFSICRFPSETYLQLNFWLHGHRLSSSLFVAYADKPGQFKNITQSGLSDSLWDARLHAFEWQMWERYMVGPNKGGRSLYLQHFYHPAGLASR